MKVFFLTIFALLFTVKIIKTEKSVQKSPCGTFIPYDPILQPNLPEIHGVLAGKFSDKTQIYVGTGKTWCGSNLPARLSIVAESGPGAYVYCAGSEIYNYSSSAYLENNSGLQWIDTDGNSFFNVSGALKVKSFSFATIYIGRANVQLSDGSNYTAIAKFTKSEIFAYISFYIPNNEIIVSSSLQILTCQ